MAGLDTLLRMTQGQQLSDLDAPARAVSSLADVMIQKSDSEFKRNAIEWFMNGEVNADKIKQFMTHYPNRNPQEILEIAGQVATQQKAQASKDAGRNYMNFWISKVKNGEMPTVQEEAKFMESLPPDQRDFIGQHKDALMKSFEPKLRDAAASQRILREKGIKSNKPEEVMGAAPTEPETEQITIYGPNGQTKRVSPIKGQEYEPPQGWTLQQPLQEGATPTDYKTFYNSQKELGKTDSEISKEWHRLKIEESMAVGKGRAEAYGDIRLTTVVDTKDPNPDTRLKTMSVNQFNDLNSQFPDRYVQSSQSPEQKEMMAAAAQRGGMRSANVQTAYDVFAKEAPELASLRAKVQAKGLLPEGIKDIGALNQWVGKKINDPDVAELQKKTKLLADTLQRTIGGTQGGQWAFEVAADILDPTYDTKAFSRILQSHTKTFARMAEAYKNFGKEPAVSSPTEAPSLSKGDIVKTGKLNGKTVYKLKNGSVVYQDGTPVQ